MNIIWVIADTFRKDYLGAYGNKTIQTPALDALAEKSVRFDRHYLAGFPTMPARADFLTGRWTMSYMQWEPLFKDEVTLPQMLFDKGIHTAGVVDTPFYLRRGNNYDIGFKSFIEITGQGILGGDDAIKDRRYEADYFAPQTFTKAMEWLERHYQEDFFLYIDTWDPHEPWDPPQYYRDMYWPGHDGDQAPPLYGYWQNTPGMTEEKVQKTIASYSGEVTMVDTWFGYLMRKVENMGLMENTAIVFTSDHGYYFGEHGGLIGKMILSSDKENGGGHGWYHSPLYEEITAVPLLIYVPGVEAAVYGGLTSAVDLAPTMMDIMGQEIPSRMEGKSLLPLMKDPTIKGREYVVSANPFMNTGDVTRCVDDNPRVMEDNTTSTITTEDWTLIYYTDPGLSELYNLKTDPLQEKNVISENPEKARELHQLLVKYMRETNLSQDLMKPRLELRL